MDIVNCRRCGKMFNYISGQRICPLCKQEEEKKFREVKDFIKENKEAGIKEISEQCDVNANMIRQWIREERLVFGDDSPIGIECEGCGTMIKSGKYCDKCKMDLARGLLNATQKPEMPDNTAKAEVKQNPKMRFLE